MENVEKKLDEAIEIIQSLMAYGKIRPINGVRYPEGTHEEMIERADKWLYRNRKPNNQIGGILTAHNEEMHLNMQYYHEYCVVNGYITPMDWIENHKHF